MNQNYHKLCLEEIQKFETPKKILLHSCCGPCSTSVIEKLKENFDITIFYYNPNIYPQSEYQKRLETQKEYLKKSHQDIKVVDGEYKDSQLFLQEYAGLEECKEGGVQNKHSDII